MIDVDPLWTPDFILDSDMAIGQSSIKCYSYPSLIIHKPLSFLSICRRKSKAHDFGHKYLLEVEYVH